MNRSAPEHETPDSVLVERARGGAGGPAGTRSACAGGPAGTRSVCADAAARDAFDQLVRRHQDRVFNLCLRMCGQEADALDLTQATFLRALEALPEYRSEAGFFTWVFRIAVNSCLSRRRQQARRAVRPLVGGEESGERSADVRAGGSETDVSRTAEQRELHAKIEGALALLEPEFRAAVVLKDVEDLDYAEIAVVLEVPVGTVKSRIHRGRMLLRELLREQKVYLEA